MWRSVWQFLIQTSSVWKVALAAGLAWDAARGAGFQHPYFAPLAAILCLQVTVAQSVARSVERVLGIVFGVVLADFAARWLGLSGWSIAALVLFGLAGARLVRLRNTAVPQVGVSAMLVLASGPGRVLYSFDRVINTLIGAAIAIAINLLLLPPDYTQEARTSVTEAARELSLRFHRVAAWLRDGADAAAGRQLQDDTRAYLETLHRTVRRTEQAVEAVSYSFFTRRRHGRLTFLHAALLRLRQGYAHCTGVLRTCLEWQSAEDAMPPAQRLEWADRIDEAARSVATWGESFDEPEPKPVPEPAKPVTPLAGAPVFAGALWNDLAQLAEDLSMDTERTGERDGP